MRDDAGRWVGVDVGGERKGFDVAVIDDRRVLELAGHLTCGQVVEIVVRHRPAVVAVDSPRSCAPEGRTARDDELRLAKSVCGIRWTPDFAHVQASAYYAWILEGLALFRALAAQGVEPVEVFPTASWTRWHGERGTRTRAAWTREGLAALGLDQVPARTNQDQRDAIAAAVTARQHGLGLTEAIGEIIVPALPWGSRPPGLPRSVGGLVHDHGPFMFWANVYAGDCLIYRIYHKKTGAGCLG